MTYYVAFTLGLFGSLHCIGMCGPIILALPLTRTEKIKIASHSLLYHMGRISSYGLLGFVMGIMGWGVAIAGHQKNMSIILGVVLVLGSIWSFLPIPSISSGPIFNKVKNGMVKFLKIGNSSSAIKLGILNGFLPCGLVYVALAGSVACADAFSGALYMMAFGLGTIPLLASVMIFQKIYRPTIGGLKYILNFGMLIVGGLLIYRGWVLEVPLDFKFWEANNFPLMCH